MSIFLDKGALACRPLSTVTLPVSTPDRVGREAILKVHTRKTPLHEEVSLERMARLTTGMSGADLANLVNEAALTAGPSQYGGH